MRVRTAQRRRTVARRAVAYVACLVAFGLGLLCVGLGWYVQHSPESRDAVPFDIAEVHTVGPRPALVGDLVVYGVPAGGRAPTLDELGCQVDRGGGPLSVDDALTEDRIVVAGRGLVPLVTFPGRRGHSIACTGQGAFAAKPLYIAPGRSGRDLIPLAAYCLAALTLPAGGVGAYLLRSWRS